MNKIRGLAAIVYIGEVEKLASTQGQVTNLQNEITELQDYIK